MFRLFRKTPPVEAAPSDPDERSAWLDRLRERGPDLMRVVGPEDGASESGDWIGAVVSLSGEDPQFPALSDAMDDGLFGPNCRNRLEAYNRKSDESEAMFCTRLAVAAMTRRRDGNKPDPDYLDAEPLIREQRAFEKLYSGAQVAEREGDLMTALQKCRAALELLRAHDLFPESKPVLTNTLTARIHTLERDSRIRAHHRTTRE